MKEVSDVKLKWSRLCGVGEQDKHERWTHPLNALYNKLWYINYKSYASELFERNGDREGGQLTLAHEHGRNGTKVDPSTK